MNYKTCAITGALVFQLLSIPSQAVTSVVENVVASSNDGNVPSNTLDGSLSTRWSANGDGQWIRYDLGSVKTVDDISIAFYRGDQRNAYFDIEVSSNASSWTQVYSGTSARNLNLQNFNIDDIDARYVRIVGHGNSANTWNSLTEVEINVTGSEPVTTTPVSTAPVTTKSNIWVEKFNKSNGTTSDSGVSAWSLNTNNLKSSGSLSVQDGMLEANNTGGVVSWVSEGINISEAESVKIKAIIEGSGKLDSTDYVQMGYRIDGGSLKRFGYRNDDLERTTVSKSGLTGDELVVYAFFKNTASDERYFLDKVNVIGTFVSDETENPTEPTPVEPTTPTEPIEGLDPSLAPGQNFDLSRWKITFPDASEQAVDWLVEGGERSNEFYTDPSTGGMVFRCPNSGETTSSKTKYPRSELREMLRGTNDSISTQGVNGNNWVLSTSNNSSVNNAGGVDGRLSATLSVDHVSTSGDESMIGRVVVGQIHGSEDEPLKIYYRKLPNNSKGSVYFTYEKWQGDDVKYHLVGDSSNDSSNPSNGIALGEKWSYDVDVYGQQMTVTLTKEDGSQFSEIVTIEDDYQNDWMYFKAGVYNQNNGGDEGDYVQATFYKLEHSHD